MAFTVSALIVTISMLVGVLAARAVLEVVMYALFAMTKQATVHTE